MSESVDILIKADDQASKKFSDVSGNLDKSMKRVEQIMRSLEEPVERYNREMEELIQLHKSGAISADQFAAAQGKIAEKVRGTSDAFSKTGQSTKVATEFAGVLANLTGNSQLAGFAGQMASATEKVSQFGTMSKKGTAGAMGFKLGMIGLAATLGYAVGKALGDIIFQTAKFNREVKAAADLAKELDKQLKAVSATIASNKKEDIELIRDPEAKRAAYKKLFTDLDKDIQQAANRMENSKKVADDWNDAWQVTGNRKQYAIDANEQLKADQETLAGLKEQRSELVKIAGARAQANEQIKLANQEKDKSESYLESLRQEVEYLKATREEQIKLDAARNTTEEDRGEAERLLQERDAIHAKAEAEKELERTRIQAEENAAKAAIKAAEDIERAKAKAAEEQQKAAEKAAAEVAKEKERIEGIKRSEQERLQLQRIELEQGAEAAKVQELINKGIDEATAKEIAAEEAAIERLKQKKAEEAAQAKDGGKKLQSSGSTPTLSANESRLLTRGPADRQEKWLEVAAMSLQQIVLTTTVTADASGASKESLANIKENTSNTAQMVPTT